MSSAVTEPVPGRLPFARKEAPFPEVNGKPVHALAPQDFLGPLNEYEVRNAPRTIYAAGDTSLLKAGRRVSVVGSRNATSAELGRARDLVENLVSHCVTVVSGLAAGIDTIAHEEVVRRGGRTIAVLGTPLDRTYPAANTELQREVIRNHVAISEFPFGGNVTRRNFAMRNRTMALISDATVVITAGENSGTRHQGWEAIRLGRELFFLEPFASSDVRWVAEQIAYGAQSLSDENLDLFLEHLPERTGLEPVAF